MFLKKKTCFENIALWLNVLRAMSEDLSSRSSISAVTLEAFDIEFIWLSNALAILAGWGSQSIQTE